MFEIPVEDFIFVVCALVGGGLLLITVLVDDILGAIFSFDIGGVSLMPLVLSFVSMFGVGGLFATQVLDIHEGQAALSGTAFGLAGIGIAYTVFSALRRAEAERPFSTADLVGHDAYLQISIPAGAYGSVKVRAEGQIHEFSATASSTSRPPARSGALAADLMAVPGIEPFANVRLAELERGGPRPLRTMWRLSSERLDARYGELTIGQLIERHGPGREAP